MIQRVLLFVFLLCMLLGGCKCDEKDEEEPILQAVKNDDIEKTEDLQVKVNVEPHLEVGYSIK